MNYRHWFRLACVALSSAGLAFSALAQDAWPSRPIKMVVPYATGGNTDVLARLLAQRLSQSIGQEVLVENRPGGNTVVGTDAVAKAPADGHTLLLTTLTFTVLPSLYEKLPFDPVKSFSPITLAATLPNVLVVNPSLPATTLQQFIDHAKAHPDKLSYASTGSGTSPHLSMAMLLTMTGARANHIPYKGGGPAMTDLLGGHVQAQFVGLPVAKQHIESGKLRALGVTGKTRSAVAPTIPAIGEVLPGYELDTWFGLLGPAQLPPAIVDRIQKELAVALRSPDLREKLIGLGAEPVGSTPGEFAASIRSEIERYRKLVKEAGIKVE